MRLITATTQAVGSDQMTIKVYRNTEWDEYIVRFFTNGTDHGESYHTTDRKEALDAVTWMFDYYRKHA